MRRDVVLILLGKVKYYSGRYSYIKYKAICIHMYVGIRTYTHLDYIFQYNKTGVQNWKIAFVIITNWSTFCIIKWKIWLRNFLFSCCCIDKYLLSIKKLSFCIFFIRSYTAFEIVKSIKTYCRSWKKYSILGRCIKNLVRLK